MNTQAVVDLTQSLGWTINQEKSELKPTLVFSFMSLGLFGRPGGQSSPQSSVLIESFDQLIGGLGTSLITIILAS